MKKFNKLILITTFLFIILSHNYVKAEKTSELLPTIYDHCEMVLIPAGEFIRGSSEEEITALSKDSGNSIEYFLPETPQKKIYLHSFYIDKYEVTNKQFQEFIEAGGYHDYRYWTEEGWNWKEKKGYGEPKWWLSGQNYSGPAYPDYPVTGVSWYEAWAYSSWAGKRLPTEAEWEKASRGTEGFIYPWGMEWDAGKCVSMGEELHPAGTIPEGISPYGIFDMAGNVWEWCSDWYNSDYYYSSPNKNPPGPKEGGYKILKGGCGGNPSYFYFRCANRHKAEINYWDAYTGFRCVKDI